MKCLHLPSYCNVTSLSWVLNKEIQPKLWKILAFVTHPTQYEAFEFFLKQCKPALRRVAAHTKGEQTFEDIHGEAWILAEDLKITKGIEIAFEDPSYQQLLISHLYNKLVRYTSQHMRYAIRLDHYRYEDGSTADEHPLLRHLASDTNNDPLSLLIEREDETQTRKTEPRPHESRAAAYLYLLQQFDFDMKAVAQHLLISLSYCYYRYNEALLMAQSQNTLATDAMHSLETFMPRSWRNFQIKRPREKMELDSGWVETRPFWE